MSNSRKSFQKKKKIKTFLNYNTFDEKISADKHNPKEAERFINSAPLPIGTVPIGHSFLDRAVRGPVPHEAKRLRLQILAPRAGN